MLAGSLGLLLVLLSTSWDFAGLLPEDTPRLISSSYPDSLERDDEGRIKEGILTAVGTEGFFDARIETTSIDGQRLLRLVPGTRYGLSRLVIDGISAPPALQVKKQLLVLENRPWDGQGMLNGLEHILEVYEDNGYPFASISIRHVLADSLAKSVQMRIAIREGPLTSIESISVADSVKTKPGIAGRLAGLRPGKLYRQSDIDEAQRRLLATGYYARVGSPRIMAGSGPNRMNLRLDLVERTTHTVRGVVGLSRDRKVAGSLDVTLRNIAGTAREAALAWEASGSGRTGVRLFYREPWVLGLPPALGIEVSQSVEDTLWVERAGQIGLEWSLGRGFRGSLGYATRRVIPGTNVTEIAPTRTNEGWGQAVWDGESRYGVRTSGYWLRIRTAYQRKRKLENDEEIPVVAVEIDGRHHLSLWRNGSLGLRGAWRQKITSEEEIPMPDQYELGGTRTLRGYREKQFRAGTVGWLSTECRQFIDQSTVLFVFFDVGVYDVDASPEWVFGYGPGLRSETALGILELGYGVPKGSSILEGRIHIALGGEF